MGWTTLYITGKSDFRDEVREKLTDSDLDVMPGYTGTVTGELVHDLYWIDEKVNLRAVKEAIGSKLVWKYRLQFYPTLEAFIEAQNKKPKTVEFTPEDLALMAEAKAAVGF
jgi:glycine betaine/choline ABC-type transport system substrate-binding protein